jgi:hypothetical protein
MKEQHVRFGMILGLSLLILLLLPAKGLAVVGDIEFVGVPPGEVITLIDETGKRTDVKTEVRKDPTGASVTYIPAQNLPEGKYTIGLGEVTAKNVPLKTGLNRIDLAKFAEPIPGWSASGQISFERRQTGQGGSGTLVPAGVIPGEEPFLVKSPKWISGASPMLTVSGPVLGKDIYFEIRGFFGSGKNSETEPSGGETVAITFDKQVAGSTGINLGATGARASSKVDVKDFEFNFSLPNLFHQSEKNRFESKIGPRLVIGHNRTDYSAHFQSLTFSGISSTKDRDVKQTYGGPGITLQKTFQLLDHVELYAGVNVDALYSSGDYDGREHTLCNLCPVAVQNVKNKTSDSDSAWSVRPAVSVGIEYEFNSSSVGANFGYEYWSNLLVLRDRPNPLKPQPGLEDEGIHRFRIGIFYQYKF